MEKVLRAYAKVNLFLDILGRREDGYHEIASLMANVSLADEVGIEPLSERRVEVEWEGPLPPPSPNLCEVAARAFAGEFGWPPGARIKVRKRIPMAAGLGGGSADAAAVLVGLASMAPSRPSKETLLRVAARVGADVPFFIVGGAALCKGIGERISPLRYAEYWLVLCGLDFGIRASEAYGLWDRCPCKLGTSPEGTARAFEEGDPEKLASCLGNALLPVVSRKFPKVGALVDLVLQAGALGATLTGSGPTVFGLARDRRHAEEVCRRLKGSVPWAAVVRTVPEGVGPAEQAL